MTPEGDNETLDVISLESSLEEVEKPVNLPAGKYIGEIIDVQMPTSQKGNRYFAVSFMISPDQYPPNFDPDNAPDGVPLFWNRVIVPRSAGDKRALWNLKQFLKAIGLDTDVTEIDPNDWMGQKATLRVRLGTYQGEQRPEIAAVEVAEAPAPRTAAAKGRGKK